MKTVTIDGRHLSFAGTGLAIVIADLLRAFDKLGLSRHMSVFVDDTFDPSTAAANLDRINIAWIKIKSHRLNRITEQIARALTVPDYVERMKWAAELGERLQKLRQNTHFIPYFSNYGQLQENVVLIPDLVWRLIPDLPVADPQHSWLWNARRRLPVRKLFQWCEERQVMRAKRLVVYSNFVRRHVNKELGLPLSRLYLVPLATPSWVDDAYDPQLNSQVIDKFCLPTRFVLYVGGFGQRKNIPMLLRALSRVHQKESDFRLVMVGLSNRFLAGALGLPIKSALSDPHVRESLIILDYVPIEELASLIRLCQFTVYPSLSEGFGLPILEAAGAQKLCLCGDNSSMKEIQLNQAFRIKAEDEGQWVEHILHYWRDPARAKKAGEDCAGICERYSWLESAQRLWQYLQEN